MFSGPLDKFGCKSTTYSPSSLRDLDAVDKHVPVVRPNPAIPASCKPGLGCAECCRSSGLPLGGVYIPEPTHGSFNRAPLPCESVQPKEWSQEPTPSTPTASSPFLRDDTAQNKTHVSQCSCAKISLLGCLTRTPWEWKYIAETRFQAQAQFQR